MLLRTLAPLLIALALPGIAAAECTVHYKAKKDDHLQLEAGTATLPDAACASTAAAEAALAPKLAAEGWTLLAVTDIVPAG